MCFGQDCIHDVLFYISPIPFHFQFSCPDWFRLQYDGRCACVSGCMQGYPCNNPTTTPTTKPDTSHSLHKYNCRKQTIQSRSPMHSRHAARGYGFNADDQPATAWLSTRRDADSGSGCNQDHIIYHELPDRQCSGLKIKCCRQRHPQ